MESAFASSSSSSAFSPCLTTAIIPQQYPPTPPSPSLSLSRSTSKRASIDDDQPTIKMEDLEQQSTVGTPSEHDDDDGTPPPSLSGRSGDSKSAKKRKSWGQVLPEPKTNLPPRKRAKTADEKEQRRIERVKRNRLAAHNSRERKRQEVELLQLEKEALESRLHAAEESNHQMAAELAAFRRMMPGLSPRPEPGDMPDPVPDSKAVTVNPRQTSFPSPESMDSLDSPLDTSSQPATPEADEPTAADLDRTQHSAAMLCDLQCQSSIGPGPLPSTRWAIIFSFLASLQFSVMMTTLLSSIRSSTSTPSATTASTRRAWRTTTTSWALAGLARRRLSSAATLPRSPRSLPSTRLARRLSTCTPTQAQQLLLATSLAWQPKSPSAAVVRILRARSRGRADVALARTATLSTALVRRRSRMKASTMDEKGTIIEDGTGQTALEAS